MHYDVIVIGLGAMGSAGTYQLARSGAKVLGIDRYEPPHIYGSTHGDTRITRLAIGEGAEYVPLVTRSHQLWREIESEVGYELLNQCGGLIMGVHSNMGQHGINDFLKQTISSAKQYGIKHDELSTEQIQARFPQFSLVGNEDGYFEQEAGFLRPEKCVLAQLELAKKYGATINTGETVTSFEDDGNSVVVKTNKTSYTAAKLIITAGPWVNELVSGYEAAFKIYRQVLYWFDLKDKTEYESYNKLPVFIWEFGGGPDDFVYGFPAVGGPDGGLKVATEEYASDILPDETKREVSQDEIESMYEKYIKDRMPGLSSKCVKAASCLYTVTPDHKFVIDYHPEHRNVIVASPCSGHGFKHSAAIGEVLSQLATTGKSEIDISEFGFNRLLL
ncbi:MAG: N-methyl-L-tryptophan oxidase [bacterium]|nr:N-methyl-L-tryptophan oxidase [bacterium]